METAKEPPGDPRRAAILQAAFDVFVENGFEAATTAEIVRRARVSKRTLYELFASKQEILTALVRYGSQKLQPSPDLPEPQSREQFLAVLEQFGRAFLRELLHPERTAMYRLAIAEAGRGGALVARELDANGRQPVMRAATQFFDQAAARGIIRREEIALLLSVYFSVLIGFAQLQTLLGTEPPLDAEAIAQRAVLATRATARMMQPDSADR
ncbi:TetR family transcriptional regulator [Rhodopseudomonas thermotolerans]|uniref:TetR family transcriptional regulator n=2 Tax=Rhodopseudomonas TaxID=1073 RepID=A0A336K2P3_9BRAD|nr:MULTISPECIES: TetR/AcrR family transcriptional regulator [Rhodopseudomonas]RED28559.1 TetR family transcriptional regulator [Rhodopseudomonas pentothenatexigens]REF91478.1 TetR family transcriptional regulator [Rhodopseudomonas thermotolerans]SSW92501.1 TetR family transcriptional regulator [Rhodopseudomonas pentothenatexigens]